MRRWPVSLAILLSGCSGVLDPRGPVGESERLILFDALAIMLAVAIPTIVATLAFAWWFRASNPRAFYWPDWEFSGRLELIVWAIPALVITFLGGIAWFGSYAVDPFRPLAPGIKPLEIEVVSLDWKWLFIYPDEGLASIGTLTIPTARNVHFRLTSNGVMNSFFVPQLGSQIYAMAGMISQLSLKADVPGTYRGISAQFSGAGFPDMHFEVHALESADFGHWLEDARGKGPTLDAASYRILAKPGPPPTAQVYGGVESNLFNTIMEETQAPPAGDPAAAGAGGAGGG